MSNTTGILLHEELDRREKLVAQLTQECDAIRIVLAVLERPSPEAHNRVTRVIGRKTGKTTTKETTPRKGANGHGALGGGSAQSIPMRSLPTKANAKPVGATI